MHSIITPLRGSFNYHEMSYIACSHTYDLVRMGRGRSHFHGNGEEETFIVTILVVLKA